MFQGSSRGWDRLAAFASKALSRGGAGPSTNTRSRDRMFNQPGEGSALARDWAGHRVLFRLTAHQSPV